MNKEYGIWLDCEHDEDDRWLAFDNQVFHTTNEAVAVAQLKTLVYFQFTFKVVSMTVKEFALPTHF